MSSADTVAAETVPVRPAPAEFSERAAGEASLLAGEAASPAPGTPVPKLLQPEPPSEDANELLGATLGGRYVVESVLGQGGMGTVYRVRHAVIGRAFALKVLRREIVIETESVRRFVQEA